MAAKQRRESDGDGDDDGVELSSVPRSRAPSYVSTRSQRSFWDGHDDADEALLPSRSKWSPDVKGPRGVETTVRTVSQTSTFTSSREKRYRLQGWRFGVTVSAWTALVVFLFNLILTIWAAVRFPVVDGIGTALDGACGQVNTWTTWLHVLINGLSSLLLSASNYTMQCLCSPTRKEIDRAHARGDWLDVGVPSVRNISRVNWRRTVLWGLLAASTVPIHLLYNSAIFKTLEANDYYMIVANTDFLQGDAFAAWYNESSTNYQIQDMYDFSPDGPNGQWSTYQYVRDVQLQFANASAYANDSSVHNLTNSECMTVYGTSYVSNYRNVLAITSAKGNQTNNTLFYYEVNNVIGSGLAYGWICEDSWDRPYGVMTCDIGRAKRDSMNWSIHGRRIEYCLAQVAAPHCKLQFSTQILTTVIVMNACKAICMFLTLWRQKDATLVTVGDAMSSFLDCPDELTRGRCLMSKVDVGKGPLRWRLRGNEDKPNTEPLPITYHAPLRRRWFSAASANRWCVAVGLCIAALIAGGSLLGMGVANLRNYGSTSTAFTMGFGNIDSRTMISSTLPQDGSSGLVSAVLLANSPQSIVSFIYLTYNALFTCMLLSQEYSKHGLANQKKPLRVTTPHGQQRSTYYLQLPYWYSVPLLVASASLHYLISQSIFLARISVYTYQGKTSGAADISEVGYSCLPILLTLLLGSALLFFAIGSGFRRFASDIPVAGSCSVALAAAAHRPKDDYDAAYLSVQWGEVHSEGNEEVGHCCFTSEETQRLVPGRMYAGSTVPVGPSGGDDMASMRARRLNRQ